MGRKTSTATKRTLSAPGKNSGTQVEIEYYTDPLCCWSWVQEPHLDRLKDRFGDRLAWRTRMGGLIADWAHYSDPLNDVNRPQQMAPYWLQVRRSADVMLDERLWLEDPPESSYPACIAVKAAQAQSAEAGEDYLNRVRRAAMLERRNIAREEVLVAVAKELAAARQDFDAARFADEYNGPEARDAFATDVKQARYLGIGRFPALTLRRPEGKGIIAIGFRPYETLVDLVLQVSPELAEPAP